MQDDNSDLDGVIDVRGLIRTLLGYKWWLLGITLGVALIVFLVAQFAFARTYTATSLIVFSPPAVDANPNAAVSLNVGTAASSIPDAKGIVDLVFADDLLRSVFQSPDLAASRQQGWRYSDMRRGLDASLSGSTQVLFEVTDEDRQRAALVANLWAQAVTDRLNTLYGSSAANVDGLRKQADAAQQAWDASEKVLQDYLAKSPVDALQAQLSQLQAAYNSRLARVQSLDLTLSDADALRAQLARRQPADPLGTGDRLAMLALQQRASEVFTCNAAPDGSAALDCSPANGDGAMQLQLADADALAGPSTAGDARASLKSFTDVLAAQQKELKDGLAPMETQLSTLRAQVEAEQAAVDQLRLKRDLAKSAYRQAYDQVTAMSIEMGAASGVVAKVAGKAMTPTSTSNRVIIYTVGGAVAAFLIAVFVLLLVDWWRRQPSGGPRS